MRPVDSVLGIFRSPDPDFMHPGTQDSASPRIILLYSLNELRIATLCIFNQFVEWCTDNY